MLIYYIKEMKRDSDQGEDREDHENDKLKINEGFDSQMDGPGNQLQASKEEKYSKLEDHVRKLRKTIDKLNFQNKRLKSRLADLQPHKQKKLRPPNQQKTKQLFSTFNTKKYALKICYLGFTYDGMAYQQDIDNTIQAYIFQAMYTLSLIQNQVPGADYTRAGRTDKGVSAMGNVICLRMRSNQPKINTQNSRQDTGQMKVKRNTKPINYCSMLNSILPEDIRILACEQVSDDFNARYWCTQRSYKYFFAKNNMDLNAMNQAIKYFVGTHNFINFCKINLTNTVNFERTIFEAEIRKSCQNQMNEPGLNEIYYFYYVGNSFLWHQIRFMSSILFLVGNHKQSPEIVKQLLDIQKYPRKPNYPMAPEYPLILQDCYYPQIKLSPEKDTVLSFHQTFNQIIIKKAVEKTLVMNCIAMAQRDLINSSQISMDSYLEEFKNRTQKKNQNAKRLQLHKSSGRSLDEAVSSLKGKKKILFEKKKEKQDEYERKNKQEKQDLAIQHSNLDNT